MIALKPMVGCVSGSTARLVSVTPSGDRDDDSDRDNATGGTDLHVGRIEPEIGPVALQRPTEEGGDLVVDLAA